MSPNVEQTDAVRKYLLLVQGKTELLMDESRKAEAEEAVKAAEAADDPLKLLEAHDQLIKATAPDKQRIEDAFLDHAKGYARAKGIGEQAFRSMGVSQEMLNRAGLGTRSASRSSGSRKPRVSAEAVKAALLELGEEFSIRTAVDASGGSVATVRKVLSELETEGLIGSRDDPQHSGRGRAQKIYNKA